MLWSLVLHLVGVIHSTFQRKKLTSMNFYALPLVAWLTTKYIARNQLGKLSLANRCAMHIYIYMYTHTYIYIYTQNI